MDVINFHKKRAEYLPDCLKTGKAIEPVKGFKGRDLPENE